MNIKSRIFGFTTFIVIAVVASLFLIEAQRTYSYNKTIAEIPSVDISITPSPTSTLSISEMISPEGSKLLTLKAVETSTAVSNTVSITEQHTDTPAIIEIKAEVDEKLQIPFNTWSPNTLYFFLKGEHEYYVFQSSRELFPSGDQYVTINSLFEQNAGNYTITEVTGWADNTLLVVNTHSDSKEKVSYWFDVPSRSFIQLGNYFE